jgi:ferredoxin
MTSVTVRIVGIDPLKENRQQVEAPQHSNIMSIFKQQGIVIDQICDGQGMCASCHFFVVSGEDALTPPTKQEQMTLQCMEIDRPGARLACQTCVTGNGLTIELPQGTFVQSEQELSQSIGKRATQSLIHPLTGEVLVEEDKLILRSAIEKMQAASGKFTKALSINK